MNMPRQKKSNLLIFGLIGGALLCCVLPLATCGGGLYLAAKSGIPLVECMGTGQALSRSMREYADAHKGQLPPAADWQTAIKPYYAKAVKNLSMKKEDQKNSPVKISIPTADDPPRCLGGSTPTVFTYNTAVAEKKVKDLEKLTDTPIFFETPGSGRNPSGAYSPDSLPPRPKFALGQDRAWFAIDTSFDLRSISKSGKLQAAKQNRGFNFGD